MMGLNFDGSMTRQLDMMEVGCNKMKFLNNNNGVVMRPNNGDGEVMGPDGCTERAVEHHVSTFFLAITIFHPILFLPTSLEHG